MSAKLPLTCLAVILLTLVGCTRPAPIEARKALSKRQYDSLLVQISPYVIKKPDAMDYAERFEMKNRHFYRNYLQLTEGKLRYYLKTDTAEFFAYEQRDLTSLYKHYRALGGYIKRDPLTGQILHLNLLYHTPRFEKEEMDAKDQVLFLEMIATGDVSKFVGNRQYIQTPNDDFYYDTNRNLWDYTPNSSWKFLQEARDLVDSIARDSVN